MTGFTLHPRPITGSNLVLDYLHRHERVAHFYNGPPDSIESFSRRASAVRGRFDRDKRATAARFLSPTTTSARQRLEEWVSSDGIVVTTGQQAGFLGGPLFTLYKALSTVRLAERLEHALDLPVLPVFWIASDDHDWAEVDHAVLLDQRGRPFRAELPPGDPRPLPMSERRLPQDLDSVLDDVTQRVLGQKGSDLAIKWIRDSYSGGRGVAAAFRELLLRVFGSVDIYLVDAADPVLKESSRWVMRETLEQAAKHEEVLKRRTKAIEAAGYRAQVSLVDRGTNVFRSGKGGRERLFRVGEGFGSRGAARRLYEAGELLGELEREPSRYSPNVLLRPVVESAVLPTVAYVGGPGEIAYFAQATALFDGFGMEPPVVVPRFSGEVVEEPIAGLMKELKLAEQDLEKGRDELRHRLAREEIPMEVAEALRRLREGVVAGYEEAIEEAGEVDPTLVGALGGMRNRSLAQVGRAERAVVRAVKKREGIRLQRLERVLDARRPLGRPQERVLSVMWPLARWGEEFVTEVSRVIGEAWTIASGGAGDARDRPHIAAGADDGE